MAGRRWEAAVAVSSSSRSRGARRPGSRHRPVVFCEPKSSARSRPSGGCARKRSQPHARASS
eukprot:8461423-Heterocapsa_arctica.AAC.1